MYTCMHVRKEKCQCVSMHEFTYGCICIEVWIGPLVGVDLRANKGGGGGGEYKYKNTKKYKYV